MATLSSLGPAHNNDEKWPLGAWPVRMTGQPSTGVCACVCVRVLLSVPSASWLELALGKCETIRGKLPRSAHK